jgi:15-cis-phytoene synthase
LQSSFDYCAAMVRKADRDRYLAALFAPFVHRNALFALYAFNVEIARIRDLAREPMPGEIRLQWWRDVLSGERDNEAAAHPIAAALQETIKRYAIVPDRLIAIVDAYSFDLYDEPMATLEDLETYATRTQGETFSLASEILGAKDESIKILTRHVGIAYVLTQILSNLARHARRGQLFLPLDLLERHAVDTHDIFAGQVSATLRAALAELRGHVRHQLSAAEAQFEFAPMTILPALLPVALIGPQLRSQERHADEPFNGMPLSMIKRQWLLWRAARNPKRIFVC